VDATQIKPGYLQTLTDLLLSDLDFACKSTNTPLHNFHSFPAKFPPELPRTFIRELTSASETVLDPMLGSGTTILEAFLENRRAIGFDIDTLALLISRVKTSSPDIDRLCDIGSKVLAKAKDAIVNQQDKLQTELQIRWDPKTKAFINFWFLPQTQLELMALLREIEQIADSDLREFLALTFSSIIITKSGGVSLAMDLGHTRPHKVPVILESKGQAENIKGKRIRSAIKEFEKRLNINLNALRMHHELSSYFQPQIHYGDAQDLPLRDNSIDLIITSPPYASNAIDYMRAHKFSLVWLGYSIEELTKHKAEYIGNTKIKDISESLPPYSNSVISEISKVDENKSKIFSSYLHEMKLVISEMFRVLKPGKAAVLVVGNSILRGKNTYTAECLAEIGQALGFLVPGIGKRNIDRNHRMMPVSHQVDLNSLVQKRIHQEYVIGFYKPC